MDPIKENDVKSEEDEKLIDVPKVNAFEVKARQKGWLSGDELKEKFKGEGKEFDPDMVVSARQYVEKGEMISELNRLKKQNRDFDTRISDNNEFWKSQLATQKADLVAKKDEAIDLADKDAVAGLDEQIKVIDQQAAKLNTPANQLSDEDAAVENEYFAGLSGRSQQLFAKDVANHFIQQNYSGKDLVDAITIEMNKEFPPTNSRREAASLTTSKSRSGKKADEITIDTLTAEDKASLSAMRRASSRYSKKSDAELLKVIKDSKL